jgi:hypothetical protein
MADYTDMWLASLSAVAQTRNPKPRFLDCESEKFGIGYVRYCGVDSGAASGL